MPRKMLYPIAYQLPPKREPALLRQELERIDRARAIAEGARSQAERSGRQNIVAACDRIIRDCDLDAARARRGEVLT